MLDCTIFALLGEWRDRLTEAIVDGRRHRILGSRKKGSSIQARQSNCSYTSNCIFRLLSFTAAQFLLVCTPAIDFDSLFQLDSRHLRLTKERRGGWVFKVQGIWVLWHRNSSTLHGALCAAGTGAPRTLGSRRFKASHEYGVAYRSASEAAMLR